MAEEIDPFATFTEASTEDAVETVTEGASIELPAEPVHEVAAHGVAPAIVAEGEWVTFDYQDVDADLLEVFLEEGDEILGAIDTTLQHWMGTPEDNALMAELQRHLHTLKGGARMANIAAIGDLSHALESLLIAVVDNEVVPSQMLFDLLLVAQDRLAHMLEAVRSQRPMRFPQLTPAVISPLPAPPLSAPPSPVLRQWLLWGPPSAALISSPA